VSSRGFGRGPWRRRTGDCGFGAWKTPQSVFVSVAKLDGSDSPSIRLGVLRVRILLAPPASPRHRRRCRRTANGPPKPRVFAGFWARALADPNRRMRVAGWDGDAGRVCLCSQVGRFGFAFDSPRSTESSNSTCSAICLGLWKRPAPSANPAQNFPRLRVFFWCKRERGAEPETVGFRR
jgi:hypothetical protein